MQEKYFLRLEINHIPASLNISLRTNRWRYQKLNKDWDRMLYILTQGRRPIEPLKKAKIRLVRHFYRMLDYDGLVGSMKPVVDALVSCGVLIDDRWDVLGQWDVSQEFRPKKDGPLLLIEIEEVQFSFCSSKYSSIC